jgi:outer membrane protein TolC
MRQSAAVVVLFTLALAQTALDFPKALETALERNPSYQNALLSRASAAQELAALEADPSTLILPLTQARQALALAEAQVAANRLSLKQSLLSAYLALLEAQANERVLEGRRALAERNLAVARARRQGGNATELDVARAEASLRSAEAALRNARAQRPALLKSLEAALGVALGAEPRLVPLPEPRPLALDLAALKEGLEARLPSLLQAQQALELAELQVALADNDYTPRLTLEKAKASRENAQKSLENARAQAEAQLESAYAQALAAWAEVLSAQDALANQEKTFSVAQKAFGAGTASRLELETEEVNLLAARQSLLVAQNAYWRALAALSVASGRDLLDLEGR